MTWQPRLPSEIEAESFRRIEAQVGPHHLPPEVWFVVRRMIHTSADLEYLTGPPPSPGHRRRGGGLETRHRWPPTPACSWRAFPPGAWTDWGLRPSASWTTRKLPRKRPGAAPPGPRWPWSGACRNWPGHRGHRQCPHGPVAPAGIAQGRGPAPGPGGGGVQLFFPQESDFDSGHCMTNLFSC